MSDLGNVGVAIGILTIHSLQAYLQCTQGLAAAILELPLPVTSDNLCYYYYYYYYERASLTRRFVPMNFMVT